MSEVQNVEILGAHTIRVTRKQYSPFIAGIVSTDKVMLKTIAPILVDSLEVEFLANIPKDSFWSGEAISALPGIAFGGLGDLMAAVSIEDVRQYVNSEYRFIEQGLRQHSRVERFVREADRLYLVFRNGLPEIRIIALNEYELTAEHLRTARDRYGNFDAVLVSNPNGEPTVAAKTVADGWNVGIFKWGALFSRLNKR